jgi:hypothetical protein
MGRDSKLVSNPAVKTLQWKNEKKVKKEVVRETGWYFWDKNANDGEGENVMVDMPFSFMWLETATSFSGYHDKLEKGIYSNEVLDIKTQKLTVRCNNETLNEGLYNSIKDAVKGVGGKYCQAVYGLMATDEGYEIVRFLMTGASASAWIAFNNDASNKTKAISCTGKKEVEMKTGATYDAPIFSYIKGTEDFLTEADNRYLEVKEYFEYVLNTPVTVEATEEVSFDADEADAV